jgi:hypothetical protein
MSSNITPDLSTKLYPGVPITEEEFYQLVDICNSISNKHTAHKKLFANNPAKLEEVCPKFCHACRDDKAFQKALEDKYKEIEQMKRPP